eukprot:3316978-Rhodomonas_salina.1
MEWRTPGLAVHGTEALTPPLTCAPGPCAELQRHRLRRGAFSGCRNREQYRANGTRPPKRH